MKTTVLFIMIFGMMTLTSCSEAEELFNDEENSSKTILSDNSPWIFSEYTIIELEDDGGSGLSPKDIETDVNQYLIGVKFNFNSDGTGFYDIPDEEINPYTWTLREGRLTTVTDTQTDVYTNVSISREEFRFNGQIITVHTRDSVRSNATHNGSYIFTSNL